MTLSRLSHLPVAAFLAAVITIGMPALAKLHPKAHTDPMRNRTVVHPVGGTVVYEGKPVAGASVTFVKRLDDDTREYLAVGVTDKAGRFWLRTFNSFGDGAVVGVNLVRIERLTPTGRRLTNLGMDLGIDIDQMFQSAGPEGDPASPRSPNPASIMGVFGGVGMCDPMPGDYPGCDGYAAFPGLPELINLLPERFADEDTSGLVAEVKSGDTNDFLIVLRQEPPAQAEVASTAATGDDPS
jgi:hypothetical protein